MLSFRTACLVTGVRFIGALNLTVGILLLALARGALDARAERSVAAAVALGIGILACVHFAVLATNESGPRPRWNPMLYADTAFFSAVALYWVAVGLGRRRA